MSHWVVLVVHLSWSLCEYIQQYAINVTVSYNEGPVCRIKCYLTVTLPTLPYCGYCRNPGDSMEEDLLPL